MWEEQPVTAEWEDSWRAINTPLRRGTDEEEEVEDDSEESEEDDTDPETQSVEETEVLLTNLEEEPRGFDHAAQRYGEEAIRLQEQLDTIREQRRRKADTPELREETETLRSLLREVMAKLRRTRRRRTRMEERCDRERKGLMETPDGWAMSKIGMWGEGHWVLLRLVSARSLRMAATSIWGHREFGVANEIAHHPGSWNRRVIRMIDGGPAELDEVGFWVTWRGETNEIRARIGTTPGKHREALIARFRNTGIKVWRDQVTELRRDGWPETETQDPQE
jgi:hypothetical protein